MTGEEFKEALKRHNLTVEEFLDLKDEWDKLKSKERYDLLMQEECKD